MKGKLLVWLLLVGLLVLPVATAFAQEVSWVLRISTWGDDYAFDVDTDSAGNVYLAGAVEGSTPDQPVVPHRDAFIAKYSAAGAELWRRLLATDSADLAYGVAVDEQGNAYVVGVSNGTLPGQTAFGGAFIARYSATGALVWLREFESGGFAAARSVAIGPDGNIVVTGWTDGALPGQQSKGGEDVMLLKYSPDGAQLWARQLGTAGNDQANGIAVDGSGNIYVAASYDGSILGNFTDAALVKLTSDGTPVWTRTHAPDQLNNYGNDVVADAAGNAYLIAAVEGDDISGSYAFVRKYDPNGATLWTDKFATPQTFGRHDLATSADMDAAGNVYVGGEFTVGTYPGQNNSGNLFARKYRPDGTVLWTHQFGPELFAYAEGIAASPTGAVYMAAYSEIAFPGGAQPEGYDAYLVKLTQGRETPTGNRVYLPAAMR